MLPQYRLVRRGGRDEIATPAGRTLPVSPGGGFVDYGYVRRGTLVLTGWAADVPTGVPAQSVLVYADGRLVFAGPPAFARPDVAVAVGKPALTHAGYAVLIPEREVRVNRARRDVRIFALVGGHALKVQYPLSYGWRRR